MWKGEGLWTKRTKTDIRKKSKFILLGRVGGHLGNSGCHFVLPRSSAK